jgi:hypothetical protein
MRCYGADKNVALQIKIWAEYAVQEMAFQGNPTILKAEIEEVGNGYSILKLETNAGTRSIKAKRMELIKGDK